MPRLVRRLGAQSQSSDGTSTPVRPGLSFVGSFRPTRLTLSALVPDNYHRMSPAPGAAKTCAQLCAAATRNQYSSTSCASWARALARQQLLRYRCLASYSDDALPWQATNLATRKSPSPSPTVVLGTSPAPSATTGFVSCSKFGRQHVIVTASGSGLFDSSTFGFLSPTSRFSPTPLLRSRCLRPGPSAGVTSSLVLQNRRLTRPSLPNAGGMPDHFDRPRPSAAVEADGAVPGSGHGNDHLHLHTNRLISEQSPYLLQHAYNPVDWYPWGEEAFARSRLADKPIFLSVGYATCHWCHVMERESFENEEIAELLNRDFISIKVDREERPDVDRVYMSYVQAVSGSGGWPMSVWLTPSLEPFYGGTYYPPKDRFVQGRLAVPGFSTVLRRIASLWQTNRQDLKDKASSTLAQLTEALKEAAAAPAGPSECSAGAEGAAAAAGGAALSPALASAAVDACAHDLGRRYDAEFGGFGGAPKFPRPCEINLLFRAASRQMDQGDPLAARRLRSMALHSLTAMASGGMYDQLGGGFHRYSVDELWHVPHFEKMLYDNTQLVPSYLAAFQLTGDKQYALVARGVLDYLLRDMTSAEGGLYSAEDADSEDPHSYTAAGGGSSSSSRSSSSSGSSRGGGGAGGAHHHGERKEGAFYVWDYSEVVSVLGPELGPFFCLVYGIDEEGNCNRSFRSDPHSEFEGKNVPYVATQPEVAAARLGLPYAGDPAEAARRLAAARERLHAARAARPRPSLDDKIVTAWNGMAIGAFALASRALVSEPQVERLCPSEGRTAGAYLGAAQRVATFVRNHLWDPAAGDGAGRLRRSFCRGPSAVQGFADDYSALISGLLDLYECGGGREWLEWAMQLQAVQDHLFWDSQSGGYFSTADPASSDADPSIRIRIKDDYDGAEPTASSVAATNLLRLTDMVPERPLPSSYGGTAAAAAEVPLMPYDEAAQRTLAAFAARLTQAPLAVPHMCSAAYTFSKRPVRQVIVAGPAGASDTAALLDAVHASYSPDKVVLVLDPTDPRDMEFWRARNPSAHDMVAAHFAKVQAPREGPASGTVGGPAAAPGPAPAAGAAAVPATAFICQNYTCQAPTIDPVRVRQLLMQQASSGSAQPLLQHFDVKL
ncbi:hypothetical protein VaNZ11_016520 [Volvox africanus]|uniref:Spermatogenesis-associated protein 20-like TRX domain-containing protein n=1 Tax=Volvox africanus TaxID=51714 RepID=A0ABQ5SN06_9CHLO|nr:hypothetical protein VaNZ11_016520 [Volvox africanus]